MNNYIHKRCYGLPYRVLSAFVAFTFVTSAVMPPQMAAAQVIPTILNLPVPGTMVPPSPAFVPVLLKGMTIHPENPLQFDFIIDSGNTDFDETRIKDESQRLVKYFLASVTIPKDDLWVNLSPYESDKIIPDELGKTELGRDMLAQDYILKQLTASLMYPEKELGKEFWDKVYKKAQEKYGTTEIPVDTFNKVWILPETATVYEHGQTVYIVDAKLKVMLDSDYEAMQYETKDQRPKTKDSQINEEKSSVVGLQSSVSSEIIKEIILPEIEREVNEGQNFAPLRQIYHSLILAKWYKETVKNSLLSQVYVDQKKTAGVESGDVTLKDQIYAQYMEAYKKGVFNYIKEDYDRLSNEVIPRKYFSGGEFLRNIPLQHSSSPIKESDNPKYRIEVGISLEGDKKGILSKLAGMPKAAVTLALIASLTCTGAGCSTIKPKPPIMDMTPYPEMTLPLKKSTVNDNLQNVDPRVKELTKTLKDDSSLENLEKLRLRAEGQGANFGAYREYLEKRAYKVKAPYAILENLEKLGAYGAEAKYAISDIIALFNFGPFNSMVGGPDIRGLEKGGADFSGPGVFENFLLLTTREVYPGYGKPIDKALLKIGPPDATQLSSLVDLLGANNDPSARYYALQAIESMGAKGIGASGKVIEMFKETTDAMHMRASKKDSSFEERWESEMELHLKAGITFAAIAQKDPHYFDILNELARKNNRYVIQSVASAYASTDEAGDAGLEAFPFLLEELKLLREELLESDSGNYGRFLYLKERAGATAAGVKKILKYDPEVARLFFDIYMSSAGWSGLVRDGSSFGSLRDMTVGLGFFDSQENIELVRGLLENSTKKSGDNTKGYIKALLLATDKVIPGVSKYFAYPTSSNDESGYKWDREYEELRYRENPEYYYQFLKNDRSYNFSNYVRSVSWFLAKHRDVKVVPYLMSRLLDKRYNRSDDEELGFLISQFGVGREKVIPFALKGITKVEHYFKESYEDTLINYGDLKGYEPTVVEILKMPLETRRNEDVLERLGRDLKNGFMLRVMLRVLKEVEIDFNMLLPTLLELRKEYEESLLPEYIDIDMVIYRAKPEIIIGEFQGGDDKRKERAAKILSEYQNPIALPYWEKRIKERAAKVLSEYPNPKFLPDFEKKIGKEISQYIKNYGAQARYLIPVLRKYPVDDAVLDTILFLEKIGEEKNNFSSSDQSSSPITPQEARAMVKGKLAPERHHLIDDTHVQMAMAYEGDFKVVYHPGPPESIEIVRGEKFDQSSSPVRDMEQLKIRLEEIERRIGKLRTEEIEEKVGRILDAAKAGKVILRDKQVDILKHAGKSAVVVGQMDRSIAEAFGYVHQTVNAIVLTPDLEKAVLIRRSPHTTPYPFHLTIPGGHPSAGETDEEGITIRLKGELGLPSLEGKLREVRTYAYGFDEKTEKDKTKERRKLFIYQLTPEEHESIQEHNRLYRSLAREGEENLLQIIEGERRAGRGDVWSYHEVEFDKIEAAAKGIDEESPYENQQTRFIEVEDIVSGKKITQPLTPDLLDHLLDNANLVLRIKYDIGRMKRGEEAAAYKKVSPYKRLVFLGPVASGKSTQAETVAADLGVPHISVGELLRDILKFAENEHLVTEDKRGYLEGVVSHLEAKDIALIEERMKKGQLIENALTDKVVQIRLSQDDAREGFVLDGYPREESSATALEDFLARRSEGVDRYVHINVSEPVSRRRLDAGNHDRSGRTDDKDKETREERLRVFNEETLPVLASRKDRVIEIDGDQPQDYVADEIMDALFVSSSSSSPVMEGIGDRVSPVGDSLRSQGTEDVLQKVLDGLRDVHAGIIGALDENSRILSVKAGKIFDIGFGDYWSQIQGFAAEHPQISTVSGLLAAGITITGGLYYFWSRYTVSGNIHRLNNDNWVIRKDAAIKLGELEDTSAVEPLIPMLKDSYSYSVRSAAAEALGKLGDKRAIKFLIPMLKDSDVHSAVAEALGRLGATKEQMGEGYLNALRSPDPSVRGAATEALGKLGDKRAIEFLIPMLKDSDSYVRRSVVFNLSKLGAGKEQIVDGYVKVLDSFPQGVHRGNVEALREAVTALRKLGDKESTAPLNRKLASLEEELKELANTAVIYSVTSSFDDADSESSSDDEDFESSSPITPQKARAMIKGKLAPERHHPKDEDVGGIDMNAIDLNRRGAGVDIQFDPVELQELIDTGIDGFAPVIINITPLPSVLPLLGLEPAIKEEPLELSSSG